VATTTDEPPDTERPDETDRYVFPTRGTLAERQVRRIRLSLSRALFQCTRCRGWFPPDKVGLLFDPVSHDVRQQPQCRRCRHRARAGDAATRPSPDGSDPP
jgi:hypothetical protein